MKNENLKTHLGKKIQTPLSEPMDGKDIDMPKVMTTADDNNSKLIALKSVALEIISDNFKNQLLSYQHFDVIKSPSGGTTVFTVPGLSGDEIEKELSGIILDYTTPRAYWNTPDPVEGTTPVCYSRDSLISHDGKSCTHCVYNDFGTKDGNSNAKACKESVEILLLRPDNIMPIIVRVPVSSKVLFQKYTTRLVGQMIPINGVVTKTTLEKATSKAGQPYALYKFEGISVLSSEETANAKAFGQRFAKIFTSAEQSGIAQSV